MKQNIILSIKEKLFGPYCHSCKVRLKKDTYDFKLHCEVYYCPKCEKLYL